MTTHLQQERRGCWCQPCSACWSGGKCSWLPVSVTAPGNAAGPSECSTLNTSSCQAWGQMLDPQTFLCNVDIHSLLSGYWKCPFSASRHKDSPAISFLGLFPSALAPWKRPSKIPKPEILAEFPWSVLPLPPPPPPSANPSANSLPRERSRGVECSPPKSGGLQGRPRPGCLSLTSLWF